MSTNYFYVEYSPSNPPKIPKWSIKEGIKKFGPLAARRFYFTTVMRKSDTC